VLLFLSVELSWCVYSGYCTQRIRLTPSFDQNFVSYAAGAVRLSALSGHQVIWVGEYNEAVYVSSTLLTWGFVVATHDSIGLGEDGPTHQPVETVAHLRAIPNLHVWRPADGNETSAAYLVALKSRSTPSVLSLTRQNLPQLGSSIERAAKGGYVLHEVEGKEDLTIVATGSEVPIAVDAAAKLGSSGYKVRVVSLPSWEIFDSQDFEYRYSVLRSGAPILSVEAYSVSSRCIFVFLIILLVSLTTIVLVP
jgi:transketolase